MPEVCLERTRLVTRYHLAHGLLNQRRITVLDKAKVYHFVLANRIPIVWQHQAMGQGGKPFTIPAHSLFAGSTTSRFKGVALFPEFMALALWPELHSLPRRQANAYWLSETDAQELNEEIFPPWMDSNLTELCRAQIGEGQSPSGRFSGLQLLQNLVFFLVSKANCISHTIPDFQNLVRLGCSGIRAQASEHNANTVDPEAKEFYAAVVESMDGLMAYSRGIAKAALDQAAQSLDTVERQELFDLAAIHEHVPAGPARTFREGLTTIWLAWIAIHLENPDVGLSLGRLDQVLWDLYRQDRAAGRLTVAEAIELVACLWLKIGDHVPSIPNAGEQLFGGTGSNQAITIGGVNKEGQDAVNELTYVILRATELMRLRDPNLNARYHAGINSKTYLRRVCEVNLNTGATPALHNDVAVIKALQSKGETLTEARDYGIVGCVEPGSNGRHYGAAGAILMNLSSVLELTLWNGEHRHVGQGTLVSECTGDPRTFLEFNELKLAFSRQAAWMVDKAVTLNNEFGKTHQRYYPTPILSSFFEGPMEKGNDLSKGGAKINSSGATLIGFADVVDSLAAIERVVFIEKSLSMADFLYALEKDYQGFEALRVRLKNPEKTPHYGNEQPEADAIALWLAVTMDGLFGKRENYRGGHYRVGYWTMTNHAGFGRLAPSTPNGRRKGENFSSGITPVSGVTPSLTKVLHSVASLPSNLLTNGIALNLKYTPEAADMESILNNFVASVESYFEPVKARRDGGMEIQFNITSRKTFIDAMEHPENYPELLVRVSGYTAYFKDLNPQMQREILERTEYDLQSGHAVPASLENS